MIYKIFTPMSSEHTRKAQIWVFFLLGFWVLLNVVILKPRIWKD